MNIRIKSIKDNANYITMSGSKSVTIRALFCAFFAFDNSIIYHANISDDVNATIDSLRRLGAKIRKNKDTICIQKTVLKDKAVFSVDVKSSATLLRFIIPAFLVLYPNKILQIKMNDDLIKRPLDGYNTLFLRNNIEVFSKGNILTIKGKIKANEIEVDNEKSSQFVSGLLLALPYLKRNIKLNFNTLNHMSYINMTLKVRESFGIKQSFDIEDNMVYKGQNYFVEGDYSNAALYIALSLNKDKTIIKNLKFHSLQGDEKIIEHLINAGARIEQKEDVIIVYKSKLQSFNLNLDNCIDLGPILFALAVFCQEQSVFTGLERLQYKESNRLKEMLNIFDNLGVKYELSTDSLTIHPSFIKAIRPLQFSSDHRILHALILLALHISDLEIGNISSLVKSDTYTMSKVEDLLEVEYLQKPKVLISINSEKDLSLPADGYVLGYEDFTLFSPHYFSYQEVKRLAKKKPIYILLNALIHEKELKRFKRVIDKLIKLNISFIVQDVGALHYLETKISGKRIIFYPYTLICQQDELNAYKIQSEAVIGISNEITLYDTYRTLKDNRGFVMAFGYVPMYQSYRKLLSLYEEYRDISLKKNSLLLKEATRNEYYHISENKYGTVIFRPYVLSYLENLSFIQHAKYIYLDQMFIKKSTFEKIIKLMNDVLNNNISEDAAKNKLSQLSLHFEDGFKYQDSIYKEKTL